MLEIKFFFLLYLNICFNRRHHLHSVHHLTELILPSVVLLTSLFVVVVDEQSLNAVVSSQSVVYDS